MPFNGLMTLVSTVTNLIKPFKADVHHFTLNSSTSDGRLKEISSNIFVISRLTFTCSKSTIEILDKDVKYV